MTTKQIKQELAKLADPSIAEHSARFFKTGDGEYGAGDHFLGIRVPALRQLVKLYPEIALDGIEELLMSKFHETRLLAVLLLVNTFTKGNTEQQKLIYYFYLNNTAFINNWDLVDSSAYKIVGVYLLNRDRAVLQHLVKSASLWERRIAIMATFEFIRNHQFDDTLDLSAQLISDKEDLIHKSVGWMLREIGKRNLATETAFLKRHYNVMPRTMLRYAIEKFPPAVRQQFLSGTY